MKMISILTAVVVLTGCVSVEEEDVSFCYERGYDAFYVDDWTVVCETPYGRKTVGKLRFEEIEITGKTL